MNRFLKALIIMPCFFFGGFSYGDYAQPTQSTNVPGTTMNKDAIRDRLQDARERFQENRDVRAIPQPTELSRDINRDFDKPIRSSDSNLDVKINRDTQRTTVIPEGSLDR